MWYHKVFVSEKVEKWFVVAKVYNELNHPIQSYWNLGKRQPGMEVNMHRGLSYLVQSFPVD